MTRFLSTFFLLILGISLSAATVTVNPQNAEIILPQNADLIQKTAAEELQKHFRLITGKTVPIAAAPSPGKYAFFIGPPAGFRASELTPEEARWEITPESARFYGEDFVKSHHYHGCWETGTRCGTMFAVYEFLEKQFGVRWPEPGDSGIYFHPSKELKFETGSGRWTEGQLKTRWLRGFPWRTKAVFQKTFQVLPELMPDDAEYAKMIHDMDIWKRRMRMGNGLNIGGSLTEYYLPLRFKDSHPEYLAMDENGKREMYPKRPEFTKLCVSNPDLPEIVANEWKKMNPRPKIVSIAPSDGFGYCWCSECRKLDVFPKNGPQFPRKGESFNMSIPMTDRYLWFNHRVLEKMEQVDPEVLIYHFAYSNYRFPPLREKVDPRMILAFVTDPLDIEESSRFIEQWKKVGLKKVFYRPNDLYMNIGMPLGFEKHLFDLFQSVYRQGAIGTDHDSMNLFWPMTGICDYILARANYEPERSFEHWEKEYCAVYEEAAADIMEYYRYWRNEIWEKRIMPSYRAGNIRHGAFRRQVVVTLGQYYNEGDFQKTDAILERAWKRNVSPAVRARLGQLRLANQHARLTYMALAGAENRLLAGRELLAFRIKHKKELNMNLPRAAEIEKQVSLLDLASAFSMYGEVVPLRITWMFRMDPDDIGTKEKWENLSLAEIARKKEWFPISVTQRWNQQTRSDMPDERKQTLKSYSGVAFYSTDFKVNPGWKGRDISLYFAGVDESAWVWINGKFVGKRLDPKLTEWANPFTLNITNAIDWNIPNQSIMVRVLKTTGTSGGIYRQVFLLSGE